MARASVLRLPNRYVVNPICRTEAGIGLSCGPYRSLPIGSSADQIGHAVMEALEGSNEVVDHPKDPSAYAKARHRAMGVKSESDVHREASLLMVEIGKAGACVTPHHNGGTKGASKGFEELTELAICVGVAEPTALGEAVLRGLELCSGNA